MIINPKFPFNKEFKKGYVYFNKEPRRVLSLIRYNGTRTCISYARYLMCVKEKRILRKEEWVDHKDDNQVNDNPKNLQILSPQNNAIKKNINKEIGRKWVVLKCPICKCKFERKKNQTRWGCKPTLLSVCSKLCLRKLQTKKLTNKQLNKIGENQLIMEYSVIKKIVK